MKAVRAVLPAEARVYAVGGVAPDTIATWRKAGASGFGIGSALFTPGRTAIDTGKAAADFVAAWKGS